MAAYRKLVRYSTVGAGAASLTFAFSQINHPQDVLGNSNVGRILNAPLEASLTACQGIVRSSRAVYTFTVNTLDYKYSLQGYDHKSEEYYQVRSQVHLRAAKRILKLCEANKGFYLKAGQFVASMQHVPKEYTSTLSTLQDQAIPCQIEAIKHVFVDNFGKDLSEIFVTFDEQPIAAASIAQVHHATLADGQEVAVKVQYPGLQQKLMVDITTMAFLSHAITWIFPEYQFEWIVPEFEQTLSRELDFVQEAENAERTRRNFRKNNAVKVPHIFWDLTRTQVLTMEFMHGCKIDNLECILRAGLNPRKMGERIGAGKYYQYLPVIFTGRTIDSKSGLGQSMPTEDRKRLSQEARNFTMGDISEFMEGLPRDMLTVLRIDGLLRSIINKLGAAQRTRLLANAKYAVAGLRPKSKFESGPSLMSRAKATLDFVYLRICLEMLQLHYKLGSVFESLLKKFKYWLSKMV